MIRISKLIGVAKSANKVPVRGGPGWDRPDVPPSQRVETDIRVIIPFIDSGLTKRSLILSSIHARLYQNSKFPSSNKIKWRKSVRRDNALFCNRKKIHFLPTLAHTEPLKP